MPSLKQEISEKLLDCSADEIRLEALYQEYKSSKGPYYAALGEATATLTQKLRDTKEEVDNIEAHRVDLEHEVDSLDDRHQDLSTVVQNLERQQKQAEEELTEIQPLLGQAGHLDDLGFGKAELAQLAELLGQTAAAHGISPEQGVQRFFEDVKDYQDLLSIDLQAQAARSRAAQAKAEAKRIETEVETRQIQSKARIATIDVVERLFDKGVKEADLANWNRILEKAGVPVEALAVEMKRHSSLMTLIHSRKRIADDLQQKITKAQASLNALLQERSKVQSAITTLHDDCLGAMNQAWSVARGHLDGLQKVLDQYTELRYEAKELEKELTLARAFASTEPSDWEQLPIDVAKRLLNGLMIWAMENDRNTLLSPPQALIKRNRGITIWTRVYLADLILWALSGVLLDKKMMEMISG